MILSFQIFGTNSFFPSPQNKWIISRPPWVSNPIFLLLLLGLVSLFADATYEGGRSVFGPYLKLVGFSISEIALIVGAGEMIGYGLRIFSGYFCDRTKRYWLFVVIGYVVNLMAIPMLAFAKGGSLVIFLIILERVGKAIRSPAKDVLLSFSTKKIGRGIGFGIHEAMDQIGAIVGPLSVAFILFYHQDHYALAFLFLLIPSILCLITLFITLLMWPKPQMFESSPPMISSQGMSFPSHFWWYVVGVVFFAFGFVDFPVLAYHFSDGGISDFFHSFPFSKVPAYYAFAMGVDGLASLFLGYLFDRVSLFAVMLSVILSCAVGPLIFLGHSSIATLVGIFLWGISMGAQESIVRAHIANIVVPSKRGTGYGIFNALYGTSWFVGSFLIAFLYQKTVMGAALLSCVSQLISLVFFMVSFIKLRKNQ